MPSTAGLPLAPHPSPSFPIITELRSCAQIPRLQRGKIRLNRKALCLSRSLHRIIPPFGLAGSTAIARVAITLVMLMAGEGCCSLWKSRGGLSGKESREHGDRYSTWRLQGSSKPTTSLSVASTVSPRTSRGRRGRAGHYPCLSCCLHSSPVPSCV